MVDDAFDSPAWNEHGADPMMDAPVGNRRLRCTWRDGVEAQHRDLSSDCLLTPCLLDKQILDEERVAARLQLAIPIVNLPLVLLPGAESRRGEVDNPEGI